MSDQAIVTRNSTCHFEVWTLCAYSTCRQYHGPKAVCSSSGDAETIARLINEDAARATS